MKRIHPNLGKAAVFAAIWFASAAGCRSQSGTMPSPFLAPDRVPPPATRALMPGQAQPYYPGDPLPVMQSRAAPAATAISSANSVLTAQATGDTGLAWSPPSTAASGPWNNGTPPSIQLAQSNEPAVAVPTDGDSLRFSLPAVDQASPENSQQTVQLAGAAPLPTVLQASFNAPVTSGPSPVELTAGIVSAAPSQSPWRPPRIAPTTVAQGAAPSSPMVSVEPQLTNQPTTIDVRLRAVPSPPPESVERSVPRIRLPGYSTSQPNASNSFAQPSQFSSTVLPASYMTGPQMAQITSMPPSYFGTASLAALPGSPASPDGFRPRGSSMR